MGCLMGAGFNFISTFHIFESTTGFSNKSSAETKYAKQMQAKLLWLRL